MDLDSRNQVGVWDEWEIQVDECRQLTCLTCHPDATTTLCGQTAQGILDMEETAPPGLVCPACIVAAYRHSCFDQKDLEEYFG